MNTAASTPPFEKGGMIRGRLIYPVEIMSPLPICIVYRSAGHIPSGLRFKT